MSSTAVSGVGTHFRRWDATASNPKFVKISEINSISGPSKTRDTIDVTSLDSIDGYREFITGFRDAGTVTLNMNFTRDSFDTMNNDFEDDDPKNYEIVLPDAENTSLEFEAFVTEVPLEIPTDDKITLSVTLKITGPVDINSGSGSA